MANSEIKDITSDMTNMSEKIAKEVGVYLKEMLKDKKQYIVEAKDNCEEVVKNRPLSSVAVAFAVGVGLGLLLKNRK